MDIKINELRMGSLGDSKNDNSKIKRKSFNNLQSQFS